jgi:hypothetical protein
METHQPKQDAQTVPPEVKQFVEEMCKNPSEFLQYRDTLKSIAIQGTYQ